MGQDDPPDPSGGPPLRVAGRCRCRAAALRPRQHADAPRRKRRRVVRRTRLARPRSSLRPHVPRATALLPRGWRVSAARDERVRRAVGAGADRQRHRRRAVLAAATTRTRRRARDRCAVVSQPVVSLLLALRARRHLRNRVDVAGRGDGRAVHRRAAATHPRSPWRAVGRQLRDKGNDLHHRVRHRHVRRGGRSRSGPTADPRARGTDRPPGRHRRVGRTSRSVGVGCHRVPRGLRRLVYGIRVPTRAAQRSLRRDQLLVEPAPGRPRRPTVSYYMWLLAAYEWPVLLLAAPGAVRALRRPTTFSASWCGTRSSASRCTRGRAKNSRGSCFTRCCPSCSSQDLGCSHCGTPGGGARVGVTAAVALAATYGAAVGVFAAIDHPADPRELLVSVQTSTDVDQIRQRLEALRRPAHQTPLAVVIDSSSGATWPWAWYLRDIPASYIRLDITAPPADADVMILTAAARRLLPAEVTNDYEVRRFRLRCGGNRTTATPRLSTGSAGSRPVTRGAAPVRSTSGCM